MPRGRRLIGCAVTLAVAVALGAPARRPPGCPRHRWAASRLDPRLRRSVLRGRAQGPQPRGPHRPGALFLPISLLSTAYVPAELLPGWVRAAAAVNSYRHVVDAVRAAMAGTLDAGQLTAAMTAVAAAVARTQLAAARRFASLVRHD